MEPTTQEQTERRRRKRRANAEAATTLSPEAIRSLQPKFSSETTSTNSQGQSIESVTTRRVLAQTLASAAFLGPSAIR